MTSLLKNETSVNQSINPSINQQSHSLSAKIYLHNAVVSSLRSLKTDMPLYDVQQRHLTRRVLVNQRFCLRFGPRPELTDQPHECSMLRVNIEQKFAALTASAHPAETVHFRCVPGMFVATALPPDGSDSEH